ncbi:MAG TPA: hypothetical protein VFK57_10460 [Vicinamibacterales bacterium]|nr:hypothetical protein [Vicinamibacterales bacterium]
MDQLLKALTDELKKLPGFAWLMIAVSTLYGRAFGEVDAILDSVVILGACWGVYRLGGRLDGPLYDSLFGPERSRNTLAPIARFQTELDRLRDEAARAIFGQARVTDYRDAAAKNKITAGGRSTLYRYCERLVKPTRLWDQEIKFWLNTSKAARGLVVLMPLLALVLALPSGVFAFAPGLADRVVTARQNLGFAGVWWIHVLIAAGALPVFLVTRYHHHHRLYSIVAEHVRHAELRNGEIRAEIVEDPIVVNAADGSGVVAAVPQ